MLRKTAQENAQLNKREGLEGKQEKGSCKQTLCFCCLRSTSRWLKPVHRQWEQQLRLSRSTRVTDCIRAKGWVFRAIKGWMFDEQ